VVRGKNRSVPSRLKLMAEEKVGRIARLAHDVRRVEVDFSELRNPRIGQPHVCEITLHLPGHFVKAHAAATEPEAALDVALDKLEHQVARIKDKRVARSHPRRRVAHNGVTDAGSAGPGGSAGPVSEFDSDDTEPDARIVKTKRFAAKPMDPEEAALQMDLLGHDFFLFTNTDTGRAAVLYRRNDGHFGLIETG
jgi:putative sigma-54 modulation protein